MNNMNYVHFKEAFIICRMEAMEAVLIRTGFATAGLTFVLAAAAAPGGGIAHAAEAQRTCEMNDSRYDRGLARINEITRGQGQAVLDSLSQTAPDLARYIIEYPYGDVFCRPGLSDRQRQLATVSALAALGYAAPELRVHIHGALNVGVTEEEIVETMILMSVYAGFPAALHGLRAAQEVFEERRAE